MQQPPYSPEAYVPSVAPPIYQSSIYQNYNVDDHKRFAAKELMSVRSIAMIQLVLFFMSWAFVTEQFTMITGIIFQPVSLDFYITFWSFLGACAVLCSCCHSRARLNFYIVMMSIEIITIIAWNAYVVVFIFFSDGFAIQESMKSFFIVYKITSAIGGIAISSIAISFARKAKHEIWPQQYVALYSQPAV